MADISSIQITGLTFAPSIAGTTEVPIQRQGVEKAEKTTIQNIGTYLVNSSTFSTFIETSVNSKVNVHISASDPHGDRAYANSVSQSHVLAVDPHGDRAYTDTTTNAAISAHKIASDPHGDRANTIAKITEHSVSADPHGDRAYALAQDVISSTETKTYVDGEISAKVTTKIGTTIAPLVSGKVPDANINQKVIFNPLASFPPTGVASILYVDTTGGDIYRWSGTSYTNLTPDVTVDNLTVTTDQVSEGVNANRKYLTAALKSVYDNKLDSIANVATLSEKNNLVKNVANKIGNIKNIKAESTLTLLGNTEHVTVTDNVYNYKGVTNNTSTLILPYTPQEKADITKNMESTAFYNIKGDVVCASLSEANGVTYITDNEKILIDACVGLKGVLEEVVAPTLVSINALGNIISGTSVINKTVKAYNNMFTEIGTGNVLETGLFTISLSSAITNGSTVYLYTIDGDSRSKPTELSTPNLGTNRLPTGLSIDKTKLILSGTTEKNSTITIEKTGSVSIGTGSSDADGLFSITLSEEVIEDQEITIKVVNSFAITSSTVYVVKIAPLIAPTSIKINNDRTLISGKAEPNSTISVVVAAAVLEIITVNSSGDFSHTMTLNKEIPSFVLFTKKDVLEYSTTYVLKPYVDLTNKLKNILKVASSNFDVIQSNIQHLSSKNKYNIVLTKNTNNIEIVVNNTEGVKTLWTATLKIDKTVL